MAGSKQKKRIASNQIILRNHTIAVGLTNLIYLIFLFFNYENFTFFKWSIYALLLATYTFCLKSIYSYAKPIEFSDGLHKTFDVNDLNEVSGTLTEYLFDILYICIFVQLSTIISDYFYFILLIIPIYAFIKIYISFIQPYLQSRNIQQSLESMKQMNASSSSNGGGVGGVNNNLSEKEKKQMKKKEKEEKRYQQQLQRMRIKPTKQQQGDDEEEDDE
ncbi:hypothetical protein ABK040_004962 [Willaertia magna]